ncbi:hypothetical protein BGLT_05256 [Caballeronia glathei]|jgi:hypothetical protein|uniref:Uncharacterized protein n=1 Tax=Caballeronia glathei TaxID=60547 RepID=A0A069PF72_9BURK|nr:MULTISPECIES: hypothetical protein [Burkholderiaceae]KDR38489.1 hypothetical protein BG61_39860 [Caballeronia glathei]TCK35026.1 hypothetical protein B0G84_6991 [Paraburkholderia sp. BL8N3]CDY76183.1 hypothetical protein BGLT_05256 [Caballeronia glathei]
MRKVIGSFHSSAKLDEALEELYAEGVSRDRVHLSTVASRTGEFLHDAADEPGAWSDWRSAEYAGHGEHLGVVDFHDHLFEAADLARPVPFAQDPDAVDSDSLLAVTVCAKDEAELAMICEVLSRLGAVDVDEARAAA